MLLQKASGGHGNSVSLCCCHFSKFLDNFSFIATKVIATKFQMAFSWVEGIDKQQKWVCKKF